VQSFVQKDHLETTLHIVVIYLVASQLFLVELVELEEPVVLLVEPVELAELEV